MIKDRISMKLFTFLLAILISAASVPISFGLFSYGAEFDENKSHWAEEYIIYCFEKEYFDGDIENFQPDESISRAMLVSCLARAAERYETKGLQDSGGKKVGAAFCMDADKGTLFSDMTGDEDYADDVKWAVDSGIVNGIDGRFCPEQAVDRQTVAVMLHRLINYLGADIQSDWSVLLDYADSDDISQWAVEGIAYCELAGLMTGNESGMFLPNKMLTRAETAVILKRFDEYTRLLKI